MGQARRIKDLEIEQNDAHQRREWHVQRVGRAAVILFVLAAVAGLFGRGGIAENTAVSSRLQVQYERIARWQCETVLLLTPFETRAGEPLEVSLNASYLRDMTIRAITPQPVEMILDNERYVLKFGAWAPGASIAISAIPRRPGRIPLVVRDAAGGELRALQLVWP